MRVLAHAQLPPACDCSHRAQRRRLVLFAAAVCVALPPSSNASLLVAPPVRDADLVSTQQRYGAAPVPAVRTRGSSVQSDRAAIADAVALLAAAREAEDRGEYGSALATYTDVSERHRDLALAHRARLARALLLFQIGDREQALLELEDELVEVGAGNAPVHAALAVVLHAQRTGPLQLARAEDQWDAATRLSPRFEDKDWVAEHARWPPAMMAALGKWLALD